MEKKKRENKIKITFRLFLPWWMMFSEKLSCCLLPPCCPQSVNRPGLIFNIKHTLVSYKEATVREIPSPSWVIFDIKYEQNMGEEPPRNTFSSPGVKHRPVLMGHKDTALSCRLLNSLLEVLGVLSKEPAPCIYETFSVSVT